MPWLFRIFILIVISTLLGCKQHKDYIYFMEHPGVIDKVWLHCLNRKNDTEIKSTCMAAMKAYGDIRLLLFKAETDGEK